jgi:hypothetical protein
MVDIYGTKNWPTFWHEIGQQLWQKKLANIYGRKKWPTFLQQNSLYLLDPLEGSEAVATVGKDPFDGLPEDDADRLQSVEPGVDFMNQLRPQSVLN